MENFNELLKKYADFIVRVGVNPQPGQTLIIRCPLEAASLARGMNQSSIHEDVMIGAEDSKITGKCRDGRTVTLFENGVWVL